MKGKKQLDKKDVETCNKMTCVSVFLPSCRSWWAGRALPRRCILSLFPHPFFPQAWKNPSQLPNNFFFLLLEEKEKKLPAKFEKVQKKNQLRLLFNIGRWVTTPRGQSPLFKKNCLKTAVEKEEGGGHTWVQSEVLMLGFSQPMLPAGQLDKPPKNPHIMPEPAAFCLENVGHF